MILNCIIVTAGGGLGALSRYLFGFIPVKAVGDFPLSTMIIINLAGSFLIGFIVSLSGKTLGPKTVLFFKTGFCGGFTTFSTFSFENMMLIQSGHYATGSGVYVFVFCRMSGRLFWRLCNRRQVVVTCTKYCGCTA